MMLTNVREKILNTLDLTVHLTVLNVTIMEITVLQIKTSVTGSDVKTVT